MSEASNRGQFNAVIASEVLEHIDNVKLFIESAREFPVPNGRLIITTINQTLAAQVLGITVSEKVLRLLPEGTHKYEKLVPINGLILLLQELGFTVESSQGMCYNPISGNWSWIPSTAINYAIVAIKNTLLGKVMNEVIFKNKKENLEFTHTKLTTIKVESKGTVKSTGT